VRRDRSLRGSTPGNTAWRLLNTARRLTSDPARRLRRCWNNLRLHHRRDQSSPAKTACLGRSVGLGPCRLKNAAAWIPHRAGCEGDGPGGRRASRPIIFKNVIGEGYSFLGEVRAAGIEAAVGAKQAGAGVDSAGPLRLCPVWTALPAGGAAPGPAPTAQLTFHRPHKHIGTWPA